MNIQKRKILRWFHIRWNNGKQMHLEKVIGRNFKQISDREECKLKFLHFFCL